MSQYLLRLTATSSSRRLLRPSRLVGLKTSLHSRAVSTIATSTPHATPIFPVRQRHSKSLVQRRYFSSSEDLAAILAREIDEEESTNESTVMPPELSELRSTIEGDWRIVDGGVGGGSGATVKLFKKDPVTGGAKIGVIFHCQDTIANEEEEEYDDDEEEEASVAVRFTVTVTRAGKTMVLSCISEDATVVVEGVAVRDGDADSVMSGSNMFEAIYQGPEFNELADDLQEAFSEYVQGECGINNNVASFISMYADYREQVEYVDWLKSVQGILK